MFHVPWMSEMSVDGCGAIKEGREDRSSRLISCSWHCQLRMAYKEETRQSSPCFTEGSWYPLPHTLCQKIPISLPTVVQSRVSGGVGTASVWGRTETSNGSLCWTNPNTFSPQSLLASFQMLCVIYDIRLIRIFLTHTAVHCPYLWASWQAAAAYWWFGGWAAGRRAASVTCPP